MKQLTIYDHSRVPMYRYIYPVVSRRAGGVSLGINLNVNSACNWACCYCQVENLQRGKAGAVDIPLLTDELTQFLEAIVHGDFMQQHVPENMRTFKDVAFSGDGEPTSAVEFDEIVAAVRQVMHSFQLQIPLRLITNGSFLHRPAVQRGIARLGGSFPETVAEMSGKSAPTTTSGTRNEAEGETKTEFETKAETDAATDATLQTEFPQRLNTLPRQASDGEVWFKFDRLYAPDRQLVNGIRVQPKNHLDKLKLCAILAPTWVQTCWFAIDQQAPSQREQQRWIDYLRSVDRYLQGVHLYGVARVSHQPAAPRLSAWSLDAMQQFAADITAATGLSVTVSP